MDNRLTPNLDPFALAHALSSRMLIDGALVPAISGKTFPVENPATGGVIAEAPFGAAADVDAAVQSAKKAQKGWAQRPARDRGKLVAECGRLLNEHVEELGRLVALETGKALRTESRVEASVLADVFVFYGGLGSELKGETVPFNPRMLNTPGGRTWFMIWVARSTVSGASSADFTTTLLPATRAGAILSAIRSSGTFHGMIAPTTPTGWRRVTVNILGLKGTVSPLSSEPSPP